VASNHPTAEGIVKGRFDELLGRGVKEDLLAYFKVVVPVGVVNFLGLRRPDSWRPPPPQHHPYHRGQRGRRARQRGGQSRQQEDAAESRDDDSPRPLSVSERLDRMENILLKLQPNSNPRDSPGTPPEVAMTDVDTVTQH